MKLFLDTNIIIDVIANRQPWVREALILLELAKRGRVTLITSDYSFINVAYVTRKLYSKEELCQLLKGLCNYIELVEVGRKVICEALENPWKDIEDCVQYLVAKRETVDVILTRNEKDFLLSDIQVQNPSSFLNAVL